MKKLILLPTVLTAAIGIVCISVFFQKKSKETKRTKAVKG